jgi:hypothetical protein
MRCFAIVDELGGRSRRSVNQPDRAPNAAVPAFTSCDPLFGLSTDSIVRPQGQTERPAGFGSRLLQVLHHPRRDREK